MDSTTLVGAVLQRRYRVEAEIGRGAMGVVYRARDLELDRGVAVKVLPGYGLDAEARARLMREARAAAALNHRNIVGVYDVGEESGAPFIVMELVEGPNLRGAGTLSLGEVVTIARQLCEALDHAHAHGVVHRDLKPENVLLARGGDGPVAKLADLGVASTGHARLTETGAIVGTAAYLAPEQALGRGVDGRSDLYALGVVLYELVTSRLPFTGDDALVVISQHLHAPVTPPRAFRADLPPALEAIILRLLAKDPAQRFANAREAGAALADLRVNGAPAPLPVSETAGGALLEQLVRGRLVGRVHELHQLRELWRIAQQGRRHVALVSGEPGAGKTRLANEAVVFARLNGAVVLQGGCYEYEASSPYLPFVEALRRWVHEQPVEVLREHAGPVAAEIVKLAPELESRIGAIPPSPALGANEERLRLFDHVARLVQTLAAGRGFLLFIDDLHWADAGSLALLHYLMRNLKDERLLVLATYREIELDRAHPLAAALVEWERERLVTRVRVERFQPGETAALLASLFGQESVSPEFAEIIHRETEGNPFFIEEVVKSLIDQGQIYRAGDGWDRRDIHDLTIPQSVKAAIGRRLDRLSPACADALHAAAAVGKAFSFEELAATTAASEDALLDALDEACAAQLLLPRGAEGFVFTHDKIREVLIEELNPIRRRRLHQRIGEGLEKLYGAEASGHAEKLAFHFTESGDLERGLLHGMEAGRQAERLFALDEALGFYERARECAESLERPAMLFAAERGLAAVHARRGSVAMAVSHFERALELAPLPAERAAIKVGIGEIYARVGDARGLEFLNQALVELDRTTQVNALALALALIGRYHHYRGHHARAIEELEKARALAEPVDDSGTLAMVYSYLSGAHQQLARYDDSNAWARRSIALGERKHDPHAVAVGYEFLAENASNRGHTAEALECAARDREIGRKIGSLDRQAWSWFPTALAHLIRGEDEAALRAIGNCVDLCERIGERRLEYMAQASLLSPLLADRGDYEAARVAAESAFAYGEESGLTFLRTQSLWALAYLAMRRGEWKAVLERCRECEAILVGADSRVTRILLAPFESAALLGLGRVDDAWVRAERGLAEARDSGSEVNEGALESVRGQILAAQGRQNEALAAFDRGIAILERLGARTELEHARARRAAVAQPLC
jgi:predicted ATPase